MSIHYGIQMKTFCERLKEERIRLNLNQSEFAAIGGVQKGAQINYEQGKRNPDADYLAAIATKGADVQYILTGVRGGFSDRLKTERAARGLSVAEFSALGGVSEAEQQDYENGVRMPSGDYLAALLIAGVDVHTLLQGKQTGEASLQSLPSSDRAKVVIETITAVEKELGIRIAPEAMPNVIRYAFSYCENPAAIKEFLKISVALAKQQA